MDQRRASLLAELQRRNVLRAAVLYAGAVWALAQGLAQLLPLFGDYGWIARWFVIAGVIGFPFWIAFDRSFDTYHGDPRFVAFCRKVGLPTTTDAKALP